MRSHGARAAVLISGWLSVLISPAAAQQAVGYVASIEGTAQLMRANQLRNLPLGEFILRGDVVIVQAPSRVRIEGRSGATEICGPSAPEADCRRLFDGTAPMVPLADWWSRSVTMVNWFRANPANLVTRDSYPPRIKIGGGAPQKLVAGDRALAIPWLDGREPFVARLTTNGAPVERAAGAGVAMLPATKLVPERVTFIVRDADDRTATIVLEIVQRSPPIPDLSASAANPQHRLLLEAAWLAVHENGAWTLEAYQRLQTVPRSDAIASSMQRALAFGDRP